jgi:hypothetical protein
MNQPTRTKSEPNMLVQDQLEVSGTVFALHNERTHMIYDKKKSG